MPENCENSSEYDTAEFDQPRYTGKCKWFNVLKGFGFIIAEGFDEDFFVHQTEINMKGFRSLDEGERVSFCIRIRKEGKGREAYQVGPEDPEKKLMGSRIHPLGKSKDKLVRCFKCGKFGHHFAQKCKKFEVPGKCCYNCGSVDHLLSACPIKSPKPTIDVPNIVNDKTNSF
ncbi:unnamed protein product [Auanema sp. JU1783]|nr:unnamed protein product [Auanema sp. JU1783]